MLAFAVGSSHRVGHVGGVGVVDDGGQRAVVVEEHDDLLPLGRRHQLVKHGQRRWVLHLHDRIWIHHQGDARYWHGQR
jgi:hypothetical protein